MNTMHDRFPGIPEKISGLADAIYPLLEKEIIPQLPCRRYGIPHAWIKVMKEAMKSTAPLHSRRTVKKSVSKFYRDAIEAAK